MNFCFFDRAWQVSLDQARAVRMAGMPGAPPPYGTGTYVQAYPGPNGGYFGPHPPPYGKVTCLPYLSKLRIFILSVILSVKEIFVVVD